MDSCVDWHAVDREVEAVRALRSLASLHKGARGVVRAVTLDGIAGITIGDSAGSTIARRLLEVGFVPGEQIVALRRREAQAVMIELERPEAV